MNCYFSALARLGIGLSMFMLPAVTPAASVVYTTFGAGSSYNTSQGNPVGNAFDGNDYAEADTFVLTGNAIFSSLQVALSCFASCTDPFSVTLARDGGNQPGAAIETFTLQTSVLGTLGANNSALVLTSSLNPTLTLGTRYWVIVSADLNDSIDWNLNSIGDGSAEALSADGGSTWFSPSGNTSGALQINGNIPEPGSAGLLVGGGLLLGLIRRLRTS